MTSDPAVEVPPASAAWLTELSRLVVLLAAGSGLGLIWNPGALRPTRPSTSSTPQVSYAPFVMTLEDAHRHWEAGEAVVLDTRGRFVYERGHIPGAISVKEDANTSLLSAARRFVGRDQIVIVVAEDDRSSFARSVGGQLRMTGYTRVHVLAGGVSGWRDAGLPLVEGWDMDGILGVSPR